MKSGIKKLVTDRKIQKLQDKYDKNIFDLEQVNNELREELNRQQISIGQWQNRCFSTQIELDSYRKAQAKAMDIFKSHYEQEKKDFMEYNTVWRDQIRNMALEIYNIQERLIQIEVTLNATGEKVNV